MGNLYDETKYEEERIAGDPEWQDSMRVDSPKVKIRWQDKILICDVYREPDQLMVHLICPKCLHGLKISSKNKEIYWDADKRSISIERFKCTWEEDTDVAVGVFKYTNLCNWAVVIDNNIARNV